MKRQIFWRQLVFVILLFIPLILLDQWTKALAVAQLKGTAGVSFIPNIWDFRYVENRSTAFNLTRGIPENVLLPLIVIVALTTLGFLLWFAVSERRRWQTLLAVAMISSGAAGNLIDRFTRGFVVDFVHWHLGTAFDWPVFNVADSLVVFGVILLLLETWLTREDQPAEPQPSMQKSDA